jgi:hypothetical protein
MSRLLIAAAGIATLAVSGCANTPASDADYGRSVSHMIEAQTYDSNAAANPPEHAPATGDGGRLQNALDAYRKDVAKGSAEVERKVEFEVGQN